MEESKKSAYQATSILSFIGAFVSVGIGFYKMFAYNNSTYEVVNAYVGADAYNFIINSNYASAYFTLAGVLILFGIAMGLPNMMNK